MIVKAAAVQASPVSFDLVKSVDKVARLVAEAAGNGAQLIVLPEAFLSAYPRHFSFSVGYRTEDNRQWYKKYVESAVKIPEDALTHDWATSAPEQAEGDDFWAFARLCAIAKEHGVFLSVGIIERSLIGSTVWCCNVVFGPDGRLLSKHRKLKPTGAERMIWHEGDDLNPARDASGAVVEGTDNMPVVPTAIGRIGGVICWENYMPLARYVLYKKGVELYLAPTADGRPTWLPSMQHVAQEGRCFVVTANQYQEASDFPADYPAPADADKVWCRGGSAIVDPLGNVLAGPLWDEEGIVYADLDMGRIHATKVDFDPVGHYSREPLLKQMLDKLW
ncbi:Nitrilase/cyanide hydratase and apolipo protein N-acyltransferase [Cutaneotrichosporon oleaginosum]|uniref:Nitrilase/cyanide hydratase and apolipo protein N-acyltransferase n=1 Tax=Cutaneotrichosporon oleaginosum TaxID=879819 RepID=A0A0J0XDS7_9TREE|nr:Nitrilase/cyanide hydratase and apolipo protein N-acyltransferase [Cutaneotrichosporon oleaginosum]KLT39227.1 Nitrilase/cyanide hydratase and apolipo protein N-acyltransferase [Cutaneotrichosporon oleaginosum]TXT05720.1 hypothetical protein COLE_07040 [Cutaneotrichosporon oleaginosum]